MTRHVLVVDDDATIREIASISLAHFGGFEVEQADGGEAGLAAARARRPDAVLLDVMMPGLDGPSVLRALREDPGTADVPVVFLTAKLMRDEQERLLQLGALGVIGKPFDPTDLSGQLAGLLGW